MEDSDVKLAQHMMQSKEHKQTKSQFKIRSKKNSLVKVTNCVSLGNIL